MSVTRLREEKKCNNNDNNNRGARAAGVKCWFSVQPRATCFRGARAVVVRLVNSLDFFFIIIYICSASSSSLARALELKHEQRREALGAGEL